MSGSGRKSVIINAISQLKRTHDEWEGDSEAPRVPTAALEAAIETAVDVCAVGDIPGDCRQLVNSMGLVAREWNRFKDGAMTTDFRPLPAFWGELGAVFSLLRGVQAAPRRTREPVHVLLDQGVSEYQITHPMHGWLNLETERWEGPLLDEYGNTDFTKLYQERDKPGSVIPADWIHPAEAARIAEEEKQSRGHFLSASQPVHDEDPATVEEMLRQGAYPEQVARAKNVSVDEVRSIARKNGIVINERPNLMDRGQDGNKKEPPVTTPGIDPPTDAAGEEFIKNTIIELHDSDDSLGSADIAAKISDQLGSKVSAQKVAGVIREHKKRLQEAGV